jgi:hypothetical protein
MKTLTAAWLVCASHVLLAQVHADRALVLTSADSAQRSIIGLGNAIQNDALISVRDAQAGTYHWGEASGTSATISLALQPPCAGYANGLLVRFIPTQPASGTVTLNVDGLGPKHIYRADGGYVNAGQLQPGTIAEAMYADSAFFLRSPTAAKCPSGFLQANTNLCFMRNDTLNVSLFNAAKWCFDRGARLCAWDEYIFACTNLQAQMEGSFGDWEWTDDTSDHTHTGVQVGRYTCNSERSWVIAEHPNNYASVRCCYHLK